MYIAMNFENIGFPGDNGTNFDIISQVYYQRISKQALGSTRMIPPYKLLNIVILVQECALLLVSSPSPLGGTMMR